MRATTTAPSAAASPPRGSPDGADDPGCGGRSFRLHQHQCRGVQAAQVPRAARSARRGAEARTRRSSCRARPPRTPVLPSAAPRSSGASCGRCVSRSGTGGGDGIIRRASRRPSPTARRSRSPTARLPIQFTAKPDLSVLESDEPVFEFAVYADVTDITGETRSAQSTLRAGYTALQATILADAWQTPDKPVQLTIQTQSLDGEGEPASGTIRIHTPQAAGQGHPWRACVERLLLRGPVRKSSRVGRFHHEPDPSPMPPIPTPGSRRPWSASRRSRPMTRV